MVERKRRGQNHGGSMMQKAIELKKMKNLEPVKGNKSPPLQYDELNQISKDIKIKIGHDKYDSTNIINGMIDSKNKRCEQFVRDNTELVLPVNLDACNITVLGDVCSQVVVDKMVKDDGPDEMGEDASSNFGRKIGSEQEDLTSPQCYIKEPNSLEL
jgi:hypothetical protein